jgi:drug/metabolite transporter (DMT)-like permease
VRTLILVEVVFSYFVSRRIFNESMNRRELAGIILVMAGVVLIVSTAR